MDPCNFGDGKNPVTKKKCKQAFGNMESYSNGYYNHDEYYTSSSDEEDSDDGDYEMEDGDDSLVSLPKDPIVQIYLASLGILGIYILYRIMTKNKK
jgi:hypothetical protein